jgi:predicted Rossmann fold flavoprotein
VKNKTTRVIVIGAGPAGMVAALEAARAGGDVLLIDKNPLSGRKLRITGAGRGNLTNLNVSAARYFTHQDDGVIQQVLSQIGPHELIRYLHDLGIFTWHTDDGWVYPLSNSAANVTMLLEARLLEAGVKLKLETAVRDIRPAGDAMRVITDSGEEIYADKVVLACGGAAHPELGSTGELAKLMKSLGHKVYPFTPALAPLVTDMKDIHALQGVRLDAKVSLWRKSGILDETEGNIIFTNWGINGPGVMDISHWVNEYPRETLSLRIDFLGRHAGVFLPYLQAQRKEDVSLAALLGAVLPAKLINLLLDMCLIQRDAFISRVSDAQFEMLLTVAQHFPAEIKGLKGFEQCQVSSGGVSLTEVDAQTLQSKRLPGLYLAGEILDVIGPCGGYNLHWALASGILAGRA